MVYVKDDIEQIDEAALQAALNKLPDWRRAEALKYKHLQGQKECAFSYLLLCDGLCQEYGITLQPHFLIGEHGKPTLQEFPHIHFSLSHCKTGIAVAISDAPVGIDIERIGRMNDSLAHHVLNDAEYAQVMIADNPELEFTKFWTMKEAVAKFTGLGITDNLKQLLSIYNNVEIITQPHPERGYVLCIATTKKLNQKVEFYCGK